MSLHFLQPVPRPTPRVPGRNPKTKTVECKFTGAKMASPANLTITARTASKSCDKSRSQMQISSTLTGCCQSFLESETLGQNVVSGKSDFWKMRTLAYTKMRAWPQILAFHMLAYASTCCFHVFCDSIRQADQGRIPDLLVLFWAQNKAQNKTTRCGILPLSLIPNKFVCLNGRT
jgi:hypothetical protein